MHELFAFLKAYIQFRIETEMGAETVTALPIWKLPKKKKGGEHLVNFLIDHPMSEEEMLVLLLGLIPHVHPGFLSKVISDFFPDGGEFPEFGGIKGKNHRGILPTGETALYLLAGNDVEKRMLAKRVFSENSKLHTLNLIDLEPVPTGEPLMSGVISLDVETVELLTTGEKVRPSMNVEFPAERIHTELEWEHLVLNPVTLNEVKEMETWLTHNDTILHQWGMKGIIKPGYRVMLYGPPGTGKTLTAALLGKYTKKDVYRIDLSMVVSKYIGQTEKNLAKLFDKAANKDWILFFDEADAIFGKRTNVKDAHDKYANQEVSYLLQRIEGHSGLVMLASNFKSNIDVAFTRRFHSIIEYKLPNVEERKKLWEANFPKAVERAPDISVDELARRYEITGANIVNVIHYACLQMLKNGDEQLELKNILDGIKREYIKEDKMFA